MRKHKKLYITKKDWDVIQSLIDTLDSWRDAFSGDYLKDLKHFDNKTVKRVAIQLFKKDKKC